MKRRVLLQALVGAMAAPAIAQSTARRRIGILALRPPDWSLELNVALLEGLRDHGYVDGRNVAIEFPDAKGRENQLPALAADLVRQGVDVILVIGPAPLPAARLATKDIPIVMVAGSADPVGEGIAASLARPGGNVTGLTYAEPDRFKKQLELLKSTGGRVAQVSVLWDFDTATYERDWRRPLAEAAQVLDVTVEDPIHLANVDSLPRAFDAMRQRRTDAFIVAAGSFLFSARGRLAELALQAKLPGIAAFKQFPQAGLLMSYGPDLADINRRAGGYVDRIFKGAKAGDVPIELPSKFDLAINLDTARALGLALSRSLELRATHLYP